MGFMLIYLTPAFYTDTTEGFVKGTRWQRFVIGMAGAWSELYIWAVATTIWWGTAPGSTVHNSAYLLMMMTGIAGLFINWNPLMKLDGYYMMSEVLQIAELKEDSTAYLSAWVKRHVWGLPVEVPYVPKNRRLGFAVYASASGAYSYTILYVLARFAGNVFRNFNPEWSFVPELLVAGLIFRSRIRKLVLFMRFVYLDKKDRIRAWMRTRMGWLAVGAAVLFCCVPLWRESVDGHFVLEPGARGVVRNKVAGTIAQVFIEEGERVRAGEPLLELRNVELQSKVGAKNAELELASIRAKEASVHYGDLGQALKEQLQLERQNAELQSRAQNLEVRSPIEGIVLTPKLREQLGEYVKEGAELVEVANLTEMRARVYVSDYEMHKVRLGSNATVNIEAFAKLWPAKVSAITPVSTVQAAELNQKEEYQGLSALNFYVVNLAIANDQGALKPGMVGEARIYGERRSLVSHFGRQVVRFFGRKIW
jgi:putative peptide zinc metalloprotease protein